MMEDVEKIAAGLGKAEREVIAAADEAGRLPDYLARAAVDGRRRRVTMTVATSLRAKGIVAVLGYPRVLTPLGLRVKEHLSEDHAR